MRLSDNGCFSHRKVLGVDGVQCCHKMFAQQVGEGDGQYCLRESKGEEGRSEACQSRSSCVDGTKSVK